MPNLSRPTPPVRRVARWGLALILAAAAAILVTAQQNVDRRAGQQGPQRVTAPQATDGRADQRASARVVERSTLDVVDRQHADNVARAVRDGLPYVPGEVLVRYRTGSDSRGQLAALNTLRLNPARTRTRWIGEMLHVVSSDIDPPEHAAEVLSRQPEVLYAHPNYVRRVERVPNDPGYSSQWNFDAINMSQAWDINWGATAGKNKVIVAVLDTGITTASGVYNYQIWTGSGFQTLPVAFSPAIDFNQSNIMTGRDFTWGSSRLFDASGHGTHVSGTIAQQTDNGINYAGIAHGATLLPGKVCWTYWDLQLYWGSLGVPGYAPKDTSGCDDADVIAAIRWAADNGADVINISLGGTDPSPSYRDAFRYAVDKGTFIAIAAGNDAQDGNPPIYPAYYATEYEGVVSVAAVNKAQQRAAYSSYGSYVELAAPGGDSSGYVYQIVPYGADLSTFLTAPRFDRYATGGKSGTSMATPHVAGVAALLYNQGITKPAAIEAALKRFAKDLGTAGRDNDFGYGLIDARATLRGLGVAK